ncbi:metallophosphoesterase family protein [Treponema sp.]
MKESIFLSDSMERLKAAPVLKLKDKDKVLVISDFHMGDGGRLDDLRRNGDLLIDILEKRYLAEGWYLVLNGDIEELQRYRLHNIRRHWKKLYDIFDRFNERGLLYKIVGNHDEDLKDEPNYPYKLYDALKIETNELPIFVFHGHQASQMYSKYNGLVRASLRYLFSPLGIRNISSARSPSRRFHVEKYAYDFSRQYGVVSLIGHTHRALFESLGRFDYIKFEIERLCHDYPLAEGENRERIEKEVKALRFELGKLKRAEKRRSLQESLYGDELPVPCLFNSGSVIGKKGITALELDKEHIELVYWFTEGEGKNFVSRGAYVVEALEGTSRRRAVLNSDRLDYLKARRDLLG